MDIVKFKEQTVTYAENQPEYMPLPAYRYAGDPHGRIVCCWKMTVRERIKVLFGAPVWHHILTFNRPLQPQLLSLEKPDMPKQ